MDLIRYLGELAQLVADVLARIAADRGEVTAEVVSATPLSADQTAQLVATLKKRCSTLVAVALGRATSTSSAAVSSPKATGSARARQGPAQRLHDSQCGPRLRQSL